MASRSEENYFLMIARTKALDDRRVDSISPWSYGYISYAGPMLSMSFEEK